MKFNDPVTAKHIRPTTDPPPLPDTQTMAKDKNTMMKCGIIMPISSFGPYSEEFWGNVRSFLEEAIGCANMDPIPAWENETNDVIHAKIIENIASFPVMVGVLIGFNPNVMIECGMRLWTNKPILLLHDPAERIPFDVGSISCLPFPIDFNYFRLSDLKKEISARLHYLTGKQYKSFKSYYTLPQEVEEPTERQKIDFSQFVNEIRSDLRLLKDTVMKYQQQTEAVIGTSAFSQRTSFAHTLSGDVLSYQARSSNTSLPIADMGQPKEQLFATNDDKTNEESDQKELQ